ncbi:hypothetical protein B0T22DRAFT_464299 [Podospora appendiculata]|uniref:Secreted protein n=1 Tax=Podospora appendiculata TaxID=314037 RepID=A0AAE1C9R6_9PEZI|nr:hypothetical protein B0T22DRAFT_464299 [Podospora appendiculata]
MALMNWSFSFFCFSAFFPSLSVLPRVTYAFIETTLQLHISSCLAARRAPAMLGAITAAAAAAALVVDHGQCSGVGVMLTGCVRVIGVASLSSELKGDMRGALGRFGKLGDQPEVVSRSLLSARPLLLSQTRGGVVVQTPLTWL